MAEYFTGTGRWRRVRRQVLIRDGYLCQIRGPKCTIAATEVDHIIPVDDGGSTYDSANLRASCSMCNSRRASRQKSQEGWRRNRARIVLVVGPPGAGKSTYIESHAGPNDLVIDYDAMARAMHGASHPEVSAARNALLTRVRRGEVKADRVWIHSTNPRAESMFPHHEVVELDPGRDVVEGRRGDLLVVIDEWYRTRGKAEGRREW